MDAKPEKTAALYLRISFDRTGEGAGVERQEQECRALAEQLGYRITAVFTDNSVSATKGKRRPGFDDLIESRPSAIFTWATDRLARKGRDLERVIDLDVPVFSVTAGPLDLSTPGGRLNARLLVAVAQHETEQASERRKAANRQKAAKGRAVGITVRPFGYVDVELTQTDPEEAEALAGAYARVIAGEPQSAIVRDWNDRGITTTNGNPWRQSSLRALLMAPRNAGLVTLRGEIVGAGEWPPIVDETTWRAAQKRMLAKPGHKPGGARKHLLTGLAACGVCGATMRATVSARGQRQYSCSAKACVGRDAVRLESLVTSAVVGRLSQPDAAALLVDRQSPDGVALAAEADAAREALTVLAEQYGAGLLPLAAFQAGTAQAQARLDDVESRMSQAAASDALVGLIGSVDVAGEWDALPLARKREVVRTLLSVTVNRTQKGSRFNPEDVALEWA